MNKFSAFLKNSTLVGKIVMIAIAIGIGYGGITAYNKFFPKAAKKAVITTKATGLPPLAYDKNANAAFRALPEFNEPVDVQAPQIRGAIMGWNGFSAANYAVGGITTSKGSLAEQFGLNISLTSQNSCNLQGEQLYAFAQALHDGEQHPTKGVHIINWMGDGVPNYLTNLNAKLEKDFGKEYIAKVVYFTGASFGEDKWLVKEKYAKDARGSVTATVPRDGDWNIIVIKSQLMGWEVNHNLGTYDKTKVNIVAAPNDDYIEAGKMYTSGQKTKLKIIENGKITGKDTLIGITGVSSWFPVDQQVVEGRGGLVNIASTKEYGAQMACAIIMISKWATDNRPIVEKMIEAFGLAGEQIKSHDEALQFAAKVNEVVFNDKEKDATAWYNAYKSFDLTDEDGNVVNIGGSRAFSLADAAAYTGVAGGTDKYKSIYNTFGAICVEAYPEVLSKFWPYEEATDWSFLSAVYKRAKKSGTEGSVSKTDFSSAQKGSIIGDAAYSIEFQTGSAEISPSSYSVLDRIVGLLTNADNSFVEVLGHTDNTGNESANQSLSEQRAASVASYLKSKNNDLAENNKLTFKGYGQSKPIADNNTAAGKSKNRRVEIKLYKAR